MSAADSTSYPAAPVDSTHTNGTGNSYGAINNGEFLSKDMGSDEALKRIRTAGSISISPELFEKLYLSPQNKVKGELRKTFANPTPLYVISRFSLEYTLIYCSALIGFLVSLSPLSCDLMGWRGAGGSGAAGTATYFFFGGLLMILGSLGEVRRGYMSAVGNPSLTNISSSLETLFHLSSSVASVRSGLDSLALFSRSITHMEPTQQLATQRRA